MSKQSLLLVDGDTRSLRVLEVSLRKAGFTVTPAVSVKDALDKLEVHTPDLILAETTFPSDLDGFELRRRIRASPEWAEIPFVFLTAETSIENKIRGLELGVDDYLTKPLYIKEIVTRINILLQKRQRANFEDRKDGVRFAGRVADMPVVDVIQTIEVSRKSGVIQFVGERGRQAAIYFRDGRVIDAEAGTLQGEDAVYRLLTWNEGEFEVEFRTVRRREAITMSSQGLLMEGMRRLDEWSRLLEQLPPLTHRFEVDSVELAVRLGEIPDDNNRILRLIDGKRAVLEVIDGSDFGDLECLQAIARLYFEGLLIDLDPEQRAKRDTGKPVPLVVVDNTPTPIEEVASGPINLGDLRARSDAGNAEPQPISAESTVEIPEHAVIDEQDIETPPASESADWTYTPPRTDEAGAPRDEASFEESQDELLPPLTGGYRPSSLRLIDEAVAAAQAIEPSLFEQPEDRSGVPDPAPVARVNLTKRVSDPRIIAARDLVEKTAPGREEAATNGRVPTPITDAQETGEMDPTDLARISSFTEEGDPTQPEGRKFAATIRRDESGLRMIGSLGRDRAEASGELTPPPIRITPPTLEPAREMVTIMPRRNTREIPAVVIDDTENGKPAHDETEDVESAADSTETPVNGAAAEARTNGTSTAPAEAPEPAAAHATAEAVEVVDAEASRRSGPGPGARIFLVLATLLSGATAYMYCHKRAVHQATAPVGSGADQEVAPPADASLVITPLPDAVEVAIAPVDAGAVIVPVDAARIVRAPRDAAEAPRAPRDAALVAVGSDSPPAPAADAGASHAAGARELVDRAKAALDDGDPDTSLAFADKSLAIKHTVAAYLVRARALQRLNRVDAALESIDEALALDAGNPAVWELKGRVLWAIRKYEDARTAFQKFLELDPNSKSAPSIRHLLEEPR